MQNNHQAGSYSYQDTQCDANPVPDEAVAGIICFITLPVRNVAKRTKAMAVVVEAAAAAATAALAAASTSSRPWILADRSP